ncbi:fasting-inducible integral membrane protein tm6p1-related [Anaeramoeba flamelloides]|uniref:Fasting-inducible integral membrane protein tm6p1-related n=1 Tax=Anaeramoeba flamelloides TaxID=1746091 RepID=A0AAV7ZPT4_9EUKA|nr:fasting-inducible integral membrane protein tm6p1-related [Anaeramoeba flamelloides]
MGKNQKKIAVIQGRNIIILAVVIGILNLILLQIFAHSLDHVHVAFPFISMTECKNPEHYITSICFTIVGFLVWFSQHLVYKQYKSLYPKKTLVLRLIYVLMCIATSTLVGQAVFNLQTEFADTEYKIDEKKFDWVWHTQVHLVCAEILFISTMVHMFLYLIFMIKTGLYKDPDSKKSFISKLVLLAILIAAYIAMQILQTHTYKTDKSSLIGISFAAVCQYIMVVTLILHYGSFYQELKLVTLKVRVVSSIPKEGSKLLDKTNSSHSGTDFFSNSD